MPIRLPVCPLQVYIDDWTKARFSNECTGDNPQAQLDPNSLSAADKAAFFKILESIRASGTTVILSSWNRQRFYRYHAAFGIKLTPITVHIPFAEGAVIPAVIHFATCLKTGKVGKILFRTSVALLVKPTECVVLAANVSAIQFGSSTESNPIGRMSLSQSHKLAGLISLMRIESLCWSLSLLERWVPTTYGFSASSSGSTESKVKEVSASQPFNSY